MSALASAIGRLEAVGDHCNAIVVKEVRQALKSRQFVGTFTLLLLVAWGGSVFNISRLGDTIEYGSSAADFYHLFFWILCVASLVIVPFAAFRSIVEERTENTLELVQITALAPRQIVWGKSLSAMVQVLVYFAAITPFIAFASLLPGFDMLHTAFDLGALLIASFAFSCVALAIGAQTRSKVSQAFGSLGVIVLSLIGTSVFVAICSDADTRLALDDPATWWGVGFSVFLTLSTAFLCQQSSIAQLTFESDNRSSGMRLTVTVQWLVSWLAVLGSTLLPSRPNVYLLLLVTASAIYITIAGLFVTAEAEGLSRRVSRGLPRWRGIRALWVPFLPGGTRGLLFGLGSLALLSTIALLARTFGLDTSHIHSESSEMRAARTAIGYAVIYLGVGAFLTRSFRRVMSVFSPGHLIAVLVLINVLLILFEHLWYFLSNIHDDSFHPIAIVNPITTYNALLDPRLDTDFVGAAIAIAALLALAINGRALVQAVVEVLNNPVRAQIDREAARRKEVQALRLEGSVAAS
jgi:hypothetical protein